MSELKERYDDDGNLIVEVYAGDLNEMQHDIMVLEARLADSVVIKEKLNELASAITSLNRGKSSLVPESVTGDNEPCYWQRKEWIDWMLELSEEARQLLSEGK